MMVCTEGDVNPSVPTLALVDDIYYAKTVIDRLLVKEYVSSNRYYLALTLAVISLQQNLLV